MKRLTLLISAILMTGSILMQAQVYKFDFSIDKKVKDGYIKVTSETLFNNERGYGYDLLPSWDGKSNQPFFFSLKMCIRDRVNITSVIFYSRNLVCV